MEKKPLTLGKMPTPPSERLYPIFSDADWEQAAKAVKLYMELNPRKNTNLEPSPQEFQGMDEKLIRGVTDFIADGRAIIHIFNTADGSTALHEIVHAAYKYLPAEDRAAIDRWLDGLNIKGPRERAEHFARANEWYWREGKAPTAELQLVFTHMAEWMRAIYNGAKEALLIKPNAEVEQVLDRFHGGKGERAKLELEPVPGEVDTSKNVLTRGEADVERASQAEDDLDPHLLKDVTAEGMDQYLAGRRDFASWSQHFIDEYGEKSRPYLDAAWRGMPALARARAEQVVKAHPEARAQAEADVGSFRSIEEASREEKQNQEAAQAAAAGESATGTPAAGGAAEGPTPPVAAGGGRGQPVGLPGGRAPARTPGSAGSPDLVTGAAAEAGLQKKILTVNGEHVPPADLPMPKSLEDVTRAIRDRLVKIDVTDARRLTEVLRAMGPQAYRREVLDSFLKRSREQAQEQGRVLDAAAATTEKGASRAAVEKAPKEALPPAGGGTAVPEVEKAYVVWWEDGSGRVFRSLRGARRFYKERMEAGESVSEPKLMDITSKSDPRSYPSRHLIERWPTAGRLQRSYSGWRTECLKSGHSLDADVIAAKLGSALRRGDISAQEHGRAQEVLAEYLPPHEIDSQTPPQVEDCDARLLWRLGILVCAPEPRIWLIGWFVLLLLMIYVIGAIGRATDARAFFSPGADSGAYVGMMAALFAVRALYNRRYKGEWALDEAGAVLRPWSLLGVVVCPLQSQRYVAMFGVAAVLTLCLHLILWIFGRSPYKRFWYPWHFSTPGGR